MSKGASNYKLTKSLEDYMRAIHILKSRKKVIRVRDIAKLLKVKPSSVTSALKKLSEMGLIKYEKYEYIDLTDKGTEVAHELSKRYRDIERFLERVLGLPKEIAEVDACNIEHYLHDETVSRIRSFIEFIERSPNRAELINEFLHYYESQKTS